MIKDVSIKYFSFINFTHLKYSSTFTDKSGGASKSSSIAFSRNEY
jgi:hypothetical protein